MAPLYRKFLGLSYSNPEKLGQLSGQTATAQRGLMLATLVNQKKMRVEDLSPNDMALAAPKMGEAGGSDVPDFGVGGFLGNLGSDIFTSAKGLLPGLWTGAKSFATDATSGALLPGNEAESELRKNVLDPVVESYKYTYGGEGTDKGFFERLYEHPLGPILDVATVFSLGAGGTARAGQALSKAGKISPESRLARLGSTQGRSSLTYPEAKGGDFEIPEISRDYSSRPLRKGLQILTDKSTGIPKLGDRIENLQRRFTRGADQRLDYSIKESQVLGNINRKVARPLIPLLNKLNAPEIEAFNLIGHGINNPALLDLYQESVRSAIRNENPEGTNIQDFEGSVDPKVAEGRANLSDETKSLVLDPEQSPALMEAMTKYQQLVDERIRPDLDEEQFGNRANAARNELLKDLGNVPEDFQKPEEMHRWDYNKFGRAERDEGIYVEDLLSGEGPSDRPSLSRQGSGDYPFQPTIMPGDAARGFEYKEPNWFVRAITDREGGFQRGPRRTFNPSNLTFQNMFQEPNLSFKPRPEAFLAGVQRPDARAFVDLLAKHERDKIEKAYHQRIIEEKSLKDENGEQVVVPGSMTPREVADKYGDDWVPVSPTYPIHWYNKELSVANAIQEMEGFGYRVDSPEMNARAAAEAEDMALDATVGARRMPSVLMPREHVEYQRALETASDPYNNKFFRGYAKLLNTWRTWTLSMMPRWAVNTAVGSFVLSTVKGVSPSDYRVAGRLKKEGVFDTEETAGVNLGSVIGMELLESGAQGYLDQAFGVKVGPGSRWVMQKVQGIEDHFRRASFVQSLDRQHRRIMNEQGAIISNVESSKGPRTTDEYIEFIMENPEAVRKALEDVNRFAYNFASLGPFERRWIRQAIPFWGWYKFISGVAYRLPVDYPGRTNLMAQIGAIGAAQTSEEHGVMPPWMAGAIPFGQGENFKYLSTMGLNPFSQFFNPLGKEGLAAGSLQLGQGSPLVQALMNTYGIDPMRGGQVPISPQTLAKSGVGTDFWGDLVSQETGAEVNPYQVAPGRRFLASLVRSFPQARIGERYMAEGRSVYPESIPVLAERPMATKPESRYGGGLGEVFQQMVGFAPRQYDLEGYQRLAKKRAKYAKTKNRRDLLNLLQGLSK